MKIHKRYMALAATAIICTASLPLGAMKQPELQKTSKISNKDLENALKHAAENGHLNIVKEFINNEVVMNKLTQEDLQKALEVAKTDEIKNEINKAIEEKNKWTCTIQ